MKTRPHKHHVFPAPLLLLILLALGQGMPAAGETKLSLSEATAALTSMISGKDWDEVPHARPVPPVDQFKINKEGRYASGSWDISPERQTFVFTLFHKEGGFWQRSGTFVQDDKLGWQATVQREVRGHGTP